MYDSEFVQYIFATIGIMLIAEFCITMEMCTHADTHTVFSWARFTLHMFSLISDIFVSLVIFYDFNTIYSIFDVSLNSSCSKTDPHAQRCKVHTYAIKRAAYSATSFLA